MKRRMRYEKEKSQKIYERKLNREKQIFALEEALAGKNSLEGLLNSNKSWSELTEYQQKRLFRQCTAVLEFLKLVNSFVGSKHKFYIQEIRQMVCDKCSFHVTPARLQQWHKDFITNGDKFSECLTTVIFPQNITLSSQQMNEFGEWPKDGCAEFASIITTTW